MGSGTEDVYAELKEQLNNGKAQVLLPDDGTAYEESIKRWSEHTEKRASCVVKVSSADDVTKTILFVRKHKIPFVVRGGGHSTSGAASIEDGLVIDLSLLRGVTVDPASRTIRAEGGALWIDVDEEAAKYGLATVGGTVNHTGVGGLTLGGGYGYLSGKYGLTIDNLLKVEMVLASGEQVVASETEKEDLFWAVRGAGQNFGVVTAFHFRAHPQENPVFAGPLIFTPDKLPEIIAFLNTFHTTTDGNQALLLGLTIPPPRRAPMLLTQLFHNGPAAEAQSIFAPLLALSPVANLTAMVPYAALNGLMNGGQGFGGRKMFGGGAYKLPLDAGMVQRLFDEFLGFVKEGGGEVGEMDDSLVLFETLPYGKVVEVGNEEMAFANRGDYYNLAVMMKWTNPTLDEKVRAFSRALLKKATQEAGVVQDATAGVAMYGNYVNTDVPASEVYGRNAQRLLELKQKYDPENLLDRGTRLVPRPLVVVKL